MSYSERRSALILLAGAIAGCGFRPLYGESSGAAKLLGSVALQEASAPEDFAYRERIRRRLGGDGPDKGRAKWRLGWTLRFEVIDVAVTQGADITRYRVNAVAIYRLESLSRTAPEVVGEVTATGAYDATASTFATRAAAKQERIDLSVELAELTVARLLADAARTD